ncbi:MAG: hypothetical protein M3Z24_09315, partial [Chloroflexota bacterium]|nr:hypothetical protein [Chloroflexota bacterium]
MAFASAKRSFDLGTSEPFDRASVSVVRLVVTYTTSASTPTTAPTGGVGGGITAGIQCTGLGVLVKSWTAMPVPGAAEQNNWVLTDGALVDPNAAMCASGSSNQMLAAIEVYANATYTANSPRQVLLGTFT